MKRPNQSSSSVMVGFTVLIVCVCSMAIVIGGSTVALAQPKSGTGSPSTMTYKDINDLGYRINLMLGRALMKVCVTAEDRKTMIADAQTAIARIEAWNNNRFATRTPGDQKEMGEIRNINGLIRGLRSRVAELRAMPTCVLPSGPSQVSPPEGPGTTPAPQPKVPPVSPPETTPAPGPEGSPPSEPLPALKLPPALLKMWPCATKEEQDQIRDLLAQIGEMKATIASLEAEIAAAQQQFDARDTTDPVANAQLYAMLKATRDRDQPQLGALNSDVSQLQQQVLDIFTQVKARGNCPPPGAVQPPVPPSEGTGQATPPTAPESPSTTPGPETPSTPSGPDAPPPPKKEPSAFENILGHVTIGIGIGVGGGGHHDNRHDHGHSDQPPATDAPPPSTETTASPHGP